MSESMPKKRTLVITDGSRERIVDRIIELVDHLSKKWFTKSTRKSLDRKHPTVLIIQTTLDDESYDALKEMLEVRYPGLCVYDPPID